MSENQPNRRLLALAGKWLSGNITAAERQEVEAWYNGFEDTRHELQSSETEKAMEARLKALIDARADIVKADKARSGSFRLAPYLKIAAAVAVITLGVWLYYASSINGRHPELGSGSPLANDIAPGKNTATLTLASGEVINLDTNKTSVVVTDSVKTATMLTASTPRGGTYQVVLPDCTKVWLNADSKISFPSQFSGKERKVVMEGEAYFEVTKNKLKPFIVESAGADGRPGQQVEVLGTHFNINTYADKGSVKTTLLEGSVRVNPLSSDGILSTKYLVTGAILKPGQQSVLMDNNEIKVQQADLEAELGWKNGDFIFNGEQIEPVMQALARWYNIDVSYEGKPSEELFYAKISRSKNISEVLQSLERTKGVHFKIEGRRVTVIR